MDCPYHAKGILATIRVQVTRVDRVSWIHAVCQECANRIAQDAKMQGHEAVMTALEA